MAFLGQHGAVLALGGEAMAIAVRIARASTGRDAIAFCGYHGWHDSVYLSANLASEKALDGHLLSGLDPAGVPRGLQGLTSSHYNRLDELDSIVATRTNRIAAIVIEPVRGANTVPGFLQGVRAIANRIGAVLVFDEVTAAFRMINGGAHLLYGVDPDMAIFAKAISNGYPMAAVIGREAVMQAAQQTFISSTSWTDRIGPAAALATIYKFRREDVASHLIDVGTQISGGLAHGGERDGLQTPRQRYSSTGPLRAWLSKRSSSAPCLRR